MSTNIDHTLEVTIGSVLFNVSNFPAKAQSHLLGQDMKPLNDKLTAALTPVIRRLQAEAWNKAMRTVFSVSIEQGDNWTPGDFHNPYKENDA